MALEQDESVLDWLAGVQKGQESLYKILADIHEDLHALAHFLTLPPVIEYVAVSARSPLFIDKQDRTHLYICAPVALELFYSDLPTAVGSTALLAITVPAGRFVELPFKTGDRLTCPGIPVTSEVVVQLLAQQAVLEQ